MKKTMLMTLAAAVLATGSACYAQSASDTTPSAPGQSKSFDLTAIDKTADPCSDFYQYACGNWNKNNPIPGDQTRWARSFGVLTERNRYLLWQDLTAAAANPKTPLQKQYGDFYASCIDTAHLDTLGAAPLKAAFARIDKLQDAKHLAFLLGELNEMGSDAPPVGFGVGQDEKDSSKQIAELSQSGISLPDRDYYIVDSPRFVAIRKQYVEHVTKMFTLAGDAPDVAAKEAEDVLTLETALAKAETSRTQLREPENRYHILTLADLDKLTPNFDWAVYFKSTGIAHFDTLNVATPDFFHAFNDLLGSQPASVWRAYLRWHTIHGSATNLSKPFRDENFAFYGVVLSGQKAPTPRWRECTVLTDRALGEAVGQDWVKENFPPAAKESMDKLVAALDKSLGDDIRDLPWMTDATKKAAEEKLALYRNKIGYPEKWRNYSSLHVERNDLVGNLRRWSVFEDHYELGKLGKPVDEKEWGMTPPTVNAYYNPADNDINFPAGILQPPFFDFHADPAVNFGGIGVVIGHEMTHGFDDEGSKYDGHGNLREWQTAEDRKAFTERTDCEVAEYGSFEAAPAVGSTPAQKLNGKLTLGENTADNGGMRIAYRALLDTLAAEGKSIDDTIDGYTEKQRYFISFAQVWCENRTDQAARQGALVDPHSPGKWRVNGTVQNFDEFGKAFGCKKGTPMYPEKSCRVW